MLAVDCKLLISVGSATGSPIVSRAGPSEHEDPISLPLAPPPPPGRCHASVEIRHRWISTSTYTTATRPSSAAIDHHLTLVKEQAKIHPYSTLLFLQKNTIIELFQTWQQLT